MPHLFSFCAHFLVYMENFYYFCTPNHEFTYKPYFTMNTKNIKQLINAVGQGLYEKEEAIRLAMLCAFAGENMFMIGLPGTAKSMISRRVSSAFKQVNYFEYLMNEFSTPDEIFGSVKLKGLEEGIYEKNTEGYLPQANVAFLDEIWKSGPAILNTLLTIINEKKFHNGNHVETVPLHMLISASNELPKEKAGLEALYDRFIVRLAVSPVKENNSFFQLCEGSAENVTVDPKLQLTMDEVRAWQEEIDKVTLPDHIKNVILDIRKEMELQNSTDGRDPKELFYVSDRRWKKIIHLLKTSAYVCGRSEVDLMDCQLISYCIWNTDRQRAEAKEIIRKIAVENGYKCKWNLKPIKAEIDAFSKAIDETFYTLREAITKKKIITKEDYSGDVYCNTSDSRYPWIKKTSGYCNTYYYSSEQDLKSGTRRGSVYVSEFSDEDFTVWINHEKHELLTKDVTIRKEAVVKNPDIFDNPRAYKTTKAAFEKDHKEVFNHINSEIDNLKALKMQQKKPYRQNLFAAPAFSALLLKQIDDMIAQLEDQLVELNKQQARYDK